MAQSRSVLLSQTMIICKLRSETSETAPSCLNDFIPMPNYFASCFIGNSSNVVFRLNWWLIMWLTDGVGWLFLQLEGTLCRGIYIHGNSCVEHIGWLGETWKIWKTSNLNEGGREHQWSYWIPWMVAMLNYQRWKPLKIGNLMLKAYFEVFEVFYLLLVEGSLWPLKIHHWVSLVTNC